jgi:tetratricopeptide (TPR) repeat protein
MNYVKHLWQGLLQHKSTRPTSNRDFDDDEIQQEYVKGILWPLNFCLKYPLKVAERYETLKANFPEIIHYPQIETRQFIEYVRLLYPEMERKGDWQEGIRYLKLALDARQAKEDLLESYLWLALFHSHIPDYEPAVTFAQKGIELAQSLKDASSLIFTMEYLARVYRSQGNYETAIRYYDETIQLAQQHNIAEEVAHAYGSKGLTYWHMKEYENALRALKTSQDMLVQFNNRKRVGHTFNNMGLVYTDLGLYREALLHFEKAVEIAKDKEDKREFALTEGNIGMAYFYLKQYDTALAYLKRTMRTMDELQSNYRLAKAKSQIGLIYQNMPQGSAPLEIALQYSKESYEIGVRRYIIHFEIIGASYQAVILKRMNRIDEAISLSKRAVELLEKVKVFDGLEEEIYFNHYLTLKEVDAAQANSYLKQSYKEVQTKLEKISNPAFRESFLKIELHQRILSEAEKQIRDVQI